MYKDVAKNLDTFDIINDEKDSTDVSLYPTQKSKWAGWFDLYNKALLINY